MGSLPATIGPYRIVRQLGEGGMGTVFEGIHGTIERRVAIKLLRPEYAHSPEMATRFINEARAVNRVEHPGIVQISDHGLCPDGAAFIVMEYLKGETLASRMERAGGKLPIGEVLQLTWQMADSLAAAHATGIIHRDVKPQNVMLVSDPHLPIGERTKILDFGLAKLATPTGSTVSKTSSNALLGTPLYMSPEQCAGAGKVDAKSDVYALGCMLYEMLGGRPPFLADGVGEILSMHMKDEPESLGKLAPSVPAPVAELVHRLLLKDRDRRPSMKRLARELEALLPLMPPPERRSVTDEEPASSQEVRLLGLASTLGHAASQSKQRRRTEWIRWSAIGVGLMVAILAGGVSLLRWTAPRKQVDEKAPQSNQQPPQVQLAATTKTTSPSMTELMPPIAQAPRQASAKGVLLKIESEPAGATIVRVTDGVSLGVTPWQVQQPPEAGAWPIRMQLTGYAPQEFTLDLNRDNQRHEVLVALDLKTARRPLAKNARRENRQTPLAAEKPSSFPVVTKSTPPANVAPPLED